MAEGIALLSVYGDADSDNDDLDDSPVNAGADAGGSIVDYAHDEGQGDEVKVHEVAVGDAAPAVEVSGSPDFQPDGTAPMVTEEDAQADSKAQDNSVNGEEAPVPSVEEDVFAGFWSSPPSTPCSEALQAKFAKFLKFKEQGRNFNEDLRHSKGYRNPDFLQLAVMHQNIDEIGSCFDPEIFDPHGYDKSDYADALGAPSYRIAFCASVLRHIYYILFSRRCLFLRLSRCVDVVWQMNWGHMLHRGPPPPNPKAGRVEAPDPSLPLPLLAAQ